MSIADPSEVSHDRQTVVTHTFRAKDLQLLCADVAKPYSKSVLAPHRVAATVTDGTVTRVEISGMRRLSGGELGNLNITAGWYRWSEVPDPIKQFLAPRIPTAIPAVKR